MLHLYGRCTILSACGVERQSHRSGSYFNTLRQTCKSLNQPVQCRTQLPRRIVTGYGVDGRLPS